MTTVNYITPITNRTSADVSYAKSHQDDLINKNIGAWNYTDANRVCNNLKYAAEYMYEQGFLSQPYSMQIKLDWKETDIMTSESLNSMIVDNMNNLKSYSRPDLTWYPIASIANMDYSIANWLERNIDALATQVPIPPDTYRLTIENGSGTGDYEAETIVTIKANPPKTGEAFDNWSGDHLENIGDAEEPVTTYTMPNEDVTLTANYTGTIPHTLTVITYTNTETVELSMGGIHYIEADPAPQGKVFHHWVVEPSTYEKNLYEPAASTHFTMPNEDVTLTAFYITKGEKQLIVENGRGSGWYEYDTYAAVSSNKPINAIFTNWTGDTQYLTGEVTQEYNSVKIPDVNVITITAHWTIPPATNIKVSIINGLISSTGLTEGKFTEWDKLSISADNAPEGQIFSHWSIEGAGSISSFDIDSANTVFTVGNAEAIITAIYRDLEYHNLTVTTNGGTTVRLVEKYDLFTVDSNPAPDGYTFDKWTGDIQTYTYPYEDWIAANGHKFRAELPVTGTYMGDSDRTITANYRPINPHTLTVKQLSGDVTYTQAEFTTVRITAEDAPAGKRFTGWRISGAGNISSDDSQTIIFTFGNGDTTLTPNYVNVWTITVLDGTIRGSSSALLDEGRTYRYLQVRNLAVYEKFDGWTQSGPGTINNTAATRTTFTVGNGDATITANISEYPDKTLTVYWRNPDTNVDTLISQETYTYGTTITGIEAVTAPNQTTFSAWLGDVELLSPSALASTVSIPSLTADTTIIATYYYPKSPEYYTLTVYDGYPESGNYAVGSQVTVTAKTPNQGWEFYKWIGDTQYFVNPDLTLSENAVIMPQQALTLRAIFNVVGELPLFEVNVTNGTARAVYYTGEEENQVEHEESGTTILIPAGIEVTLTAEPDLVGWVFDYWDIKQSGVTDIVKTENPATFTMIEDNLDIIMVRREQGRVSVYGTNATSLSEVYPDTYPINGTLQDTNDYHYVFSHWTCVDADGNDCISAIEDPDSVSTNITVTENKDLWIEAVYVTYYRLTVVEGQDTGSGYYYEGQTVNTVYANTPTPESKLQFDHWEDPTGVIQNIYDPTPTIIMKNTVSTITAVFTSIDAKGNSIAITGDDIHDGLITRHDSYLINGVYSVGTIVFDKDGCIGVITQVDPDGTDNTDDFKVEKLFYGGNF